jgi:hypothetical protein
LPKTGEAIPKEKLLNIRNSKHFFGALNVQQQIVYSLFDLAFHGPRDKTGDTMQIFEELQNKHCLIPHVAGTHWYTKFGHIVRFVAHLLIFIVPVVMMLGITAIFILGFSAAICGMFVSQRIH